MLLINYKSSNSNRSTTRTIRISQVLKGVNYLLPIQIDDNVEEMYLMIKLSKNMTRISKKSIVGFIDSVYTDVYDYRKDDLLSKTTATMPDVIDIKDLRV
jgi:hypothetical protein